MATFYSNTNTGYRLRLDVTQTSQNVTANTSSISYTLKLESTTASFGQWGHNRSLSINGTEVYNATSQISISKNSTLTLATGTRTIAHNSDGTKSISLVASFDARARASWVVSSAITINTSMTLTTIPRASQPTLNYSTRALGSSITISTNRASTSFTHTLTYAFGNQSGTIATGVTTSQAWTLPASLASAIPNATSGTGTITCQTYNGNTLIGSKSVSFTATVPDNSTFRPTATISSVVEGASLPSGITVFVQNKSRAKVTSTGAGKYSATIKTYSVAVANIGTYTGSVITSAFLRNSGSVRVTVTVTDSRGLKGSTYQDINVVAYSPPQIPTVYAYRSGSTPTNILISYNASISSVSNQNSVVYRIRSRASGGSWVVNKNVTTGYTSSESFSISSDADKSYTIEIYVADKWTSITRTVQVGTAFTLIDFNDSGKGMAIGKVSESDSFEVDLLSKFNSPVTLDGVSVMINEPAATGGWARGLTFRDKNLNTYGSVGFYGTADSGPHYIYFGDSYDDPLALTKTQGSPPRIGTSGTIWYSGNSNIMTDSGSNANGRYIRFSDGTLICFHTLDLGSGIAFGSGAGGDIYRTNVHNWTFPHSFVGLPRVTFGGIANGASFGGAHRGYTIVCDQVFITYVGNIQGLRLTSLNSDINVYASCVAIGRWE